MSLRIAFVGVGGIAKRHLDNCKARTDVTIVGHCDVNLERAQAVAAQFGGNAYDDYAKLYRKEKPDAIVICTPPFAHGDIEIKAIRRGIHFFVEKPVAVNMKTARRVAKALASHPNVISQVGYMFRLAEGPKKVRELLSKRAVAMVQQHYYMPGLPSPPWWPKMEQGGGQLIEQATHMLDLGRFLAGDVKTVSGATAKVRDWNPPADYQPAPGLLKYAAGFEIPDTTALVMQYQSGALGTLSCSLVPQKAWDNGFKVVADGLLVTLEGPNARWTGDEEGALPSGKDWPNYVLNEFIEAVKTGGKTSVPYEEGVKSLAVSIAGYESVKKGGKPVELAKLM